MLHSTAVANQKPHRSDNEQTRNGKRPSVENPWSHPRVRQDLFPQVGLASIAKPSSTLLITFTG